jgi:hypothetical protein
MSPPRPSSPPAAAQCSAPQSAPHCRARTPPTSLLASALPKLPAPCPACTAALRATARPATARPTATLTRHRFRSLQLHRRCRTIQSRELRPRRKPDACPHRRQHEPARHVHQRMVQHRVPLQPIVHVISTLAEHRGWIPEPRRQPRRMCPQRHDDRPGLDHAVRRRHAPSLARPGQPHRVTCREPPPIASNRRA